MGFMRVLKIIGKTAGMVGLEAAGLGKVGEALSNSSPKHPELNQAFLIDLIRYLTAELDNPSVQRKWTKDGLEKMRQAERLLKVYDEASSKEEADDFIPYPAGPITTPFTSDGNPLPPLDLHYAANPGSELDQFIGTVTKMTPVELKMLAASMVLEDLNLSPNNGPIPLDDMTKQTTELYLYLNWVRDSYHQEVEIERVKREM